MAFASNYRPRWHRYVERGTRLYEPLLALTTMVVCYGFTNAIMQHGSFNKANPGARVSFDSARFDVSVAVPGVDLVEATFANIDIPKFTLGLVDPIDGRGMIEGKSMPSVFRHFAAPVFMTFFEQHHDWLKSNVSTDPYQWPSVLNFARVIRNAIGHGGIISMDNPKAMPVDWHGVTYGPAQNKDALFGASGLETGDLALLMIEASDALDALGAPI